MKFHHATLTLSLALALTSCATDLRTGTLSPQTSDNLQAGFVYYLPAAVISPAATLRVAGCPVDEKAEEVLKELNPKTLPPPIKEAQFAASGDIGVEQVQGLPVLIDYRELADFLKTTSLTLERQPNGMLKSVGVTVEDETPSILANGALIAADIALFAVNPPAAASVTAAAAGLKAQANKNGNLSNALTHPATEEVTYVACRPETSKLVAARAEAVKRKSDDTSELEQANAALARLLRNTDPGLTPEEIKLVHQYRDRIIELTAELADDSETISSIDTKISLKLTAPVGTDTSVDGIKKGGITLGASDEKLRIFIDRNFVVVTAKVQAGLGKDFATRECTQAAYQTCASLPDILGAARAMSVATLSAEPVARPQDGNTPSFSEAPAAQAKRTGPLHPSRGIIYVEPAVYALSLKRPAYPPNPVAPETTLKAVKATVPQLGTYLVLPVHAGFGEKVTLNATFNADGSLITASYGRPSSAGKAISTSLAGLADKYLTTYDAVQDRKLKLLKAQADQLTAQKAVLDAQNGLKGDPLANINAEIAVITAQATLAEANLRLNAANAKLNAGQ